MADSIYPFDFPFQPHFVEIDGLRIAYFDEGQGKTIFMVHGNPVAGFVYVRLMHLLVSDFRCVVVDLPGFGMSDKPELESDYSLEGYISILSEFVQILDLQDVAVVGHDWGGPIGFGTAVTDPQRYSHLIILNTMTEAPMKIMPIYWLPFHVLLRMRRLFAYLVKERNLFQKLGVAIMEPADQELYFRANHNAAARAAIAAFPRLIPHNNRHPSYPVLKQILKKLESWEIPALVLFSDHDSVFTVDQGERFARRLVNGRFQLIAGPKHFLQYERPAEIAAAIRSFLQNF
ncbi:MAG: alpha/beta fold hydrolase [Anaerolineales bacterium]|nr:alpha/beta fold hydrolase [Anaerolineales bacterium]